LSEIQEGGSKYPYSSAHEEIAKAGLARALDAARTRGIASIVAASTISSDRPAGTAPYGGASRGVREQARRGRLARAPARRKMHSIELAESRAQRTDSVAAEERMRDRVSRLRPPQIRTCVRAAFQVVLKRRPDFSYLRNLENVSAEFTQGRSDRRSSPWPTPPRSRPRTSSPRRRRRRLRQARAAGSSNRR
jgi:hypothetical protein